MKNLLVTIPQASELLMLGKTTIYARINSGDLQKVRIGRSSRITLISIVDFVVRHINEAPVETLIHSILNQRPVDAVATQNALIDRLYNIPNNPDLKLWESSNLTEIGDLLNKPNSTRSDSKVGDVK